MKGLYKGKYLIAVYDRNDCLIDVAISPSEISCYGKGSIAQMMCKMMKGERTCNRIHLIDVTEKHDDIFSKEDDLFLQYVSNSRKLTNAEKAERLHICERDYYRKNFNKVQDNQEKGL